MKNICVIITARPSYSRIRTAMKGINKHPKLNLQLVVCGSALLDRYGSVVEYIERDGFQITEKVYNVLEGENLTAAAKTTGIGIIELSSVFGKLKPDIVVTVADRYETMATAIAATYMNIPLAHIQGGEVTGNIDEKVRHSITKLADYHLVSSKDAYDRVVKMGEQKDSVFMTGCPSLDLAHEIMQNPKLDFDPYEKYGGVGSKPEYIDGYWVVLQHPVTTEMKDSRRQIETTLGAMHSQSEAVFVFWPNVDAGADGTSTGIRAFREKHDLRNFHFFKNMEPIDFLRLLYNSKGLIGNSSVGIRECSLMGVPTINIGTRQNARARGENVIDTSSNIHEINESIKRLKDKKIKRNELYGDGKAGGRIARILSEVKLKFHKTITY